MGEEVVGTGVVGALVDDEVGGTVTHPGPFAALNTILSIAISPLILLSALLASNIILSVFLGRINDAFLQSLSFSDTAM